MWDVAYAMARSPEGGAGGGAAWMNIVFLLLIFGIFYLIVFRPQHKRQKTQQALLRNLRKGDMVVTSGGIHGTINSLTDTIVNLKVASNVNIDVNRSQIAYKKGDSTEEPK
jgi:preprotein translocase subunit YajC